MMKETKTNLQAPLVFFYKLISIQSEAKQKIKTPVCRLSKEALKQRLIAGHPALEIEDLSIDWHLLHNAFEKVSILFSNYPEIVSSIEQNRGLPGLMFEDTIKAWFKGKILPFIKDDNAANSTLLELKLRAAFSPFLAVYRSAVYDLIDQKLWGRNYCPVCGGSPDLSYLEKERGERWLVCSLCDAEWRFKRLQCPNCNSQDQNSLSYYTDEKGLYRLYVCDKCRSYLKAIDLRQTEEEISFPIERFLTFSIDIQAQKSGYKPVARANFYAEMTEGC